MPKFLIKLPNGVENSFFTQDTDIFIGRIPSINDVCIDEPSISRQHAHIKKKEEGYTIYDLKSLNGLSLNGKRISRAVLHHGDILKLGEVIIEVGLKENQSGESLNQLEDYDETKVHNVNDLIANAELTAAEKKSN